MSLANGFAGSVGEVGVRVRWRAARVAVVLWLMLAVLMLCACGALGAVGHGFVWGVSEAPPGTGLVGPGVVGVDGVSGRVFVGDGLAGYVDVFDAQSGAFVSRFGGGLVRPVGVGVAEVSGDVFVADRFAEGVDVYGSDGSGGYELLGRWWGGEVPGGEFGVVAGVAVNNFGGPYSGDVFVLESRTATGGGGAVDVFRPDAGGGEGTFVGRWSSSKFERPNGIVVDGTGRVLVADSAAGAVFNFGPEGTYDEKLNGKGSPFGAFVKGSAGVGDVVSVGVDGGSGDVLVAEAERGVVSEYGLEGGEWKWRGWITTTPEGDLGEPAGVEVTPAGGVVVADAGRGMVDGFGPGVMVPGVTTEKVKKAGGGLTRTSATLLGAINGEGKAASYRFQYGETMALGVETASQAAGTGLQAVSASVAGLEAGHAYYYRIVGENENGPSYGVTERFETLPSVDGLETGIATRVGKEDTTLTGSLKRQELETTYYFQYGTSTAYGMQAPEPAGEVPPAAEEKEEKQPKTVEAALSGLSANTTYHYRLVAANRYGTTYGQDRTFTTVGPPVIVIEPVSERGQTSVTLNATVNPEQSETTYRFQYGPTAGYGQQTDTQTLTVGSTPVPVSTVLGVLKVGMAYHYRLVAENTQGLSTSEDQTFTMVLSAPVDATYATGIGSDRAVLHGLVNSLGNDTHVLFQYGTQPCETSPGSCSTIPQTPGTDIGAASTDAPVQASITGLIADTTYHYRVLASNTLGTTEGPEHTFTTKTETALVLPDGRAWEMVTPPDKQGAPVEALTREGGIILAAKDGNGLTYVVDGAQGEEVEGNRSPEMQQILATRTPTGWTNRDIATPNDIAKGIAPGNAPEYQYFTPELSLALVEPPDAGAEPPLVEGVTQNTAYLRDNQTGTYLPLVSEANTPPGTVFDGRTHFVSGTPDLSHVVLTSEVALTTTGVHGLYEWSGGKLSFVSGLPGGKPAKEPQLGYYSSVLSHAISDDGSRVFWTNKEDLGTRGGHLYVRDIVRGETLKVDAAQGVTEPEKGSAEFQGASSDGSRVFFIDRQQLTSGSTAEPGQGTGEPDLYECVIVEAGGRLACELHDLTVVEHGGHADVQGLVLGISEDGSSVFLVAQGVLASNENGIGERAVAGQDNLYELRYDGTEWARTFIATLSEKDGPEWEGNQNANMAYVTARVSPNGRYFAFMSQAPITGYDNIDASATAEGARDEEVFLYDSLEGSLRCVSCNPSGARPEGVLDHEYAGEGLGLVVDRRLVWGREGNEHWLAGNVPGWTSQTLVSAIYQSRYLSNDGRLYFNSPDSLVPAARNHKMDVYEYEPSGVGSCESPSGGCVALLSGGESARESAFLEATPTGGSVFFLTQAQLLGQDTDTAFDIYDARECSPTSECVTPPAEQEEPCGDTEACRPAEPAEPIPNGPAGTASFTGPGNTIAPPPSSSPPSGGVEGRKISKHLTRAQKLKRALKKCRERHAHSKHKRKACEHNARKRYVKKHKHHKQTRKTKKKRKARAGSVTGRAGRSVR